MKHFVTFTLILLDGYRNEFIKGLCDLCKITWSFTFLGLGHSWTPLILYCDVDTPVAETEYPR